MPHFAKTTYNSGNPPGIDAPWLDALGDQVQDIYSTIMLQTPYLLLNTTINSGVVNTQTISGITSGSQTIPSGITAVILSMYYSSTTVGAYVHAYAHSASLSDLSMSSFFGMVQVSGTVAVGTCTVLVDSSGKVDIKAENGNCTGLHCSVLGYIY